MMLGMSVWESTLQRHIPAESLSRVSSYDFGLFLAAIVALFAVPDIRRLSVTPLPVSTARA
jgi:hypothetical protein